MRYANAHCFRLASYYRRLIKNFGKVGALLTKMLVKYRPLVWDDDAKNALSKHCT